MSRRDIISLFYRHLRRDASGRCVIEIGRQRCRVEVEDTAYVVWAVRWAGHGDGEEDRASLLLSDGSLEPLDPGTLRIGKDNIPYCRVKNGCFDARFSRSGYYQLAGRVEHDPSRDAYFISLRGQRHYISGARSV